MGLGRVHIEGGAAVEDRKRSGRFTTFASTVDTVIYIRVAAFDVTEDIFPLGFAVLKLKEIKLRVV